MLMQVPPNSAPVVENHALDPANNNILPLEGALVPYEKAAQL